MPSFVAPVVSVPPAGTVPAQFHAVPLAGNGLSNATLSATKAESATFCSVRVSVDDRVITVSEPTCVAAARNLANVAKP